MRGDVLFWTADGSIASRVIQFATHGPFTHVSVDVGDGTDIGATSDGGVQHHPVPTDRGITKFHTSARVATCHPGWTPANVADAITDGLAFMQGEVGNHYGWCNILNNALAFFHLPYRLARIDYYDCSSLVTRYLLAAGVNMGELGEEPDSVSPNDLARRLGLSPDRYGPTHAM